jgi:protein EFR3
VDGISASDVQELEAFATSILQEICGRTLFANIKAVMSPALKHLDNNDLWVPGEFAIHVIKTICYAIPNQYAYKAVQIIVGHLDNHVQSPPEMKTTIAKCLAQTVDIATSVGKGQEIRNPQKMVLIFGKKNSNFFSKNFDKFF